MSGHEITITGQLIEVGDDGDSRARITIVSESAGDVSVYMAQECVIPFGPHVYSKVRLTIEVLP